MNNYNFVFFSKNRQNFRQISKSDDNLNQVPKMRDADPCDLGDLEPELEEIADRESMRPKSWSHSHDDTMAEMVKAGKSGRSRAVNKIICYRFK